VRKRQGRVLSAAKDLGEAERSFSSHFVFLEPMADIILDVVALSRLLVMVYFESSGFELVFGVGFVIFRFVVFDL
jgi:hypothetical protein